MGTEFKTAMLTVDETLPGEVQKLHEDGWQLIEGIKPVAVYQLTREVADPVVEPARGPQLVVSVDESKVYIIRNGQRVES